MIESIAALHDAVVISLAAADELNLIDVGISLDQARLKLEDELIRRADRAIDLRTTGKAA